MTTKKAHRKWRVSQIETVTQVYIGREEEYVLHFIRKYNISTSVTCKMLLHYYFYFFVHHFYSMVNVLCILYVELLESLGFRTLNI